MITLFQKVEGIVLRTIDYGDSSKILTIFTKERGKIAGMARGAKKTNNRFAAMSQPLAYGYFLINESTGMHTIQQAEVIEQFRDIQKDIFITAHASYIIELFDKAVEEKQGQSFLYDLLLGALRALEEGYDYEIVTMMCELKLLPLFGITPQLHECVSCQRTDLIAAFSVREGGFLCAACKSIDYNAFPITSGQVQFMRALYLIDIHRLGSVTVKTETKKLLRKILDDYFETYCGVYFKSKRFLNQLDGFATN